MRKLLLFCYFVDDIEFQLGLPNKIYNVKLALKEACGSEYHTTRHHVLLHLGKESEKEDMREL